MFVIALLLGGVLSFNTVDGQNPAAEKPWEAIACWHFTGDSYHSRVS